VNKVVVRYADGRTVKGTTSDFVPAKDLFHLTDAAAEPGARSLEVRAADLKAVFFVKDLAGDPQHKERNEFDPARPAVGRHLRVEFADGEVLIGTTQGYQPNRPGFFMEPADAGSNIERCYVVAAAVRSVEPV
jgi:hypothetical protein